MEPDIDEMKIALPGSAEPKAAPLAERLRSEECAGQVDVDDLAPFLGGHVHRIFVDLDAGGGHEHLRCAQVLGDGGEGGERRVLDR